MLEIKALLPVIFSIFFLPATILWMFYWLWIIRIGRSSRGLKVQFQLAFNFITLCRFYGRKKIIQYYIVLILIESLLYLVLFFLEASVFSKIDVIFLSLIFVLMLFDAHYFLLPDPAVYLLLWLGILMALLGCSDISLSESVLGVLGFYFVMLLVYVIGFWRYGREAIGRGDLKYASAIGAWIGVDYMFLFLLLSAGMGVVYGVLCQRLNEKNKNAVIPFGPFLGGSGIIIYFIMKIP